MNKTHPTKQIPTPISPLALFIGMMIVCLFIGKSHSQDVYGNHQAQMNVGAPARIYQTPMSTPQTDPRYTNQMPARSYAGAPNSGMQYSRGYRPQQPMFIDQQGYAVPNVQHKVGDRQTGYVQPAIARSNGVNIKGAEFRDARTTATEILIEYKDQNFLLREQINTMNLRFMQIGQQLKTEKAERANVERQLAQSNSEIKTLRALAAKYKVRVDSLVEENATIEQNADKALREIEANLDAALMNSLITSKEKDLVPK